MAQPADKTESLFPDIIELNVGGQVYVTRHETLLAVPNSRLWSMFNGSARSSPGEQLGRDRKGRFFIDRDGFLFRYILDYLRNLTLVLPDYFTERASLLKEADFFQLHDLSARLRSSPSKDGNSPLHGNSPEENVLLGALASTSLAAAASSPGSTPNPCLSPSPGAVDPRKSHGYITIGYRGSYTIGRDIQTDHKFRRVARITVCGKTSLAKEVFGENLNESRDPDRPPERYTSRYYLKYNFLEQAFDQLAEAGFHMVACSSTGTCAYTSNDPNEDKVWSSYTEYVFCRD